MQLHVSNVRWKFSLLACVALSVWCCGTACRTAAGRAVCDWGDWGLCWTCWPSSWTVGCGGHAWRAALPCWYAEQFSPPPMPSYSWRQCSWYSDAANPDTLNGIRIGCITIAQSILFIHVDHQHESMLMSCFWWCHCGASRSGASFIRQTCDQFWWRCLLTFGLQIKFPWAGWMVESLKIIYQFPQDDKLPKTNTTRYFVCFSGHLSCIGLRVSTKTPVLFLATHWEFSPVSVLVSHFCISGTFAEKEQPRVKGMFLSLPERPIKSSWVWTDRWVSDWPLSHDSNCADTSQLVLPQATNQHSQSPHTPFLHFCWMPLWQHLWLTWTLAQFGYIWYLEVTWTVQQVSLGLVRIPRRELHS